MERETSGTGYWARLVKALLGRPEQPALVGDPALLAKIAALELDLRERDEGIERMRAEYGRLEAARQQAAQGGGQEQLERLFKKLTGPLSNLDTLASSARAGREVQISDLLDLFAGLEKELNRAGLERIGDVGEATVFKSAVHQRMSGGTVHEGAPVTVRIPGYRWKEKILLKSMVSAKED